MACYDAALLAIVQQHAFFIASATRDAKTCVENRSWIGKRHLLQANSCESFITLSTEVASDT
jgi:hypothetical protein